MGQARRSYESRQALFHTSNRRAERIRKRRSRYFENLDTLEVLVRKLDDATSRHFSPETQIEVLGYLKTLSMPCWAARYWSVVDEFRRRFPDLCGRTHLRIDWILYLTTDICRNSYAPTRQEDG